MTMLQDIAGSAFGRIVEEGDWPVERRRVLDWLVTETTGERYIDNILFDMCVKLTDVGVPIARATLHFRINHPEWAGARMLWRPGLKEAEIQTYGYATKDTSQYANSPIAEIHNGADLVRYRLEGIEKVGESSLYKELRADGLTEYVAWPLTHTLGKRHVVSFATDRPGGFEPESVAYLTDLLPALSLVSEIRIKNRLARTLLETYVGPHASELILAGATTRGSGTTVGAAILICDLRDFTAISDTWPRDDVIELLNGYFDAMSEPIEAHGGEILKFMGDGLLAIFPLSNPDACANLLKAIGEAQLAMRELNLDHVRHGRKPLGYGIGIHVGDVMYGNIGSRTRLDFTVIGPAVNVASRIESLTKVVKRPILLSSAFVELAGFSNKLENVGAHMVKGVDAAVEVFAWPELPDAGPATSGA